VFNATQSVPMTATSEKVLADLERVTWERSRRQSVPGLAARVEAIKRYQQRRFMLTYADLLQSERYGPAARFFLEELYGPGDFAARDAQFARVVPSIVRVFPDDIVQAISALAELHALSEALDSAMATELESVEVDARTYAVCWQRSADPEQRSRQISLTIGLGKSLERLTRKPILRATLRLMRGPAQAAGLGDMQQLLEAGFDAFVRMRGASEFLSLVESRERLLSERIFRAPVDEELAATFDRIALGLP
jgi:hypothetical protein